MNLLQLLTNVDTRTGVFSCLTLTEIQESVRPVCKRCRNDADEYKARVLKWILSHQNPKVLIVDLKSEQGKLLNGRIVEVVGPPNKKTGRFPVSIDANWVSGESEMKTLKLNNIHPFYKQPFYKDMFTSPQALVDYTDSSNIRESHGRMLHYLLGFARWFVVEAEELKHVDSINQFLSLPLSHPFISFANHHMFDYWNEAPFRCSRSRVRFGTALDYTVGMVMFNNDDLEEASREKARYSEIWPADGPQGKNLMRNFFHCMKSWNNERVTGGFWVTDEYKTGTVMVHLSDVYDPESFSTVYLVKGHNNTISELVKRQTGTLPGFCRTTILPLYDFWTYDGIVIPGKYQVRNIEEKLREHVSKAIYSGNVSWRGRSSEKGLWDFQNNPPPVPTYLINDGNHIVLDWHDENFKNGGRSNNDSSTKVVYSDEEMEFARKIALSANRLGSTRKLGEESNNVEGPYDPPCLSFRRKRGSNCCTVLDSRIGMPVHAFRFVDSDGTRNPTYSLVDLLKATFEAMEKASPRPFVTCILIDNRTLVRSLDGILVNAFEELGLIAPEINFF